MSNNGVELFTKDGKVDKRIEQLCMGIMEEINRYNEELTN
jgi:hypothetical protein